MLLTEETALAGDALPVAQFKAHLRLGTGFTEDSVQDEVVQSFLRAAISAIEARTGKIMIARDFAWTLYGWADAQGAAFPVAPVTALNGISLTDADGGETPVELDRVRIEADTHRPVLRPRGLSLPIVPASGSVTVRFTAGIAPDWAGIPADLAQAVLLLAAHYYEFRDETSLSEGCMPFGVTSLIQRYRPLRLYMGSRP